MMEKKRSRGVSKEIRGELYKKQSNWEKAERTVSCLGTEKEGGECLHLLLM
jgi:hypothetical protein